MKATIHAGFASTLKHEKEAKRKGRAISEHNADWKYTNAEYMHDLKRADVHKWKSDRATQAQHNRLIDAIDASL